MAKLAKKQISEIERISIFTDLIKIHDSGVIAGQHWVDLPVKPKTNVNTESNQKNQK